MNHSNKCSAHPLLSREDREAIASDLLSELNGRLQNRAREVSYESLGVWGVGCGGVFVVRLSVCLFVC